jgi:hypothetical protein
VRGRGEGKESSHERVQWGAAVSRWLGAWSLARGERHQDTARQEGRRPGRPAGLGRLL